MGEAFAYWSTVGLLDGFTLGADNDTLKEEAAVMFAKLDKDQNGVITKEELLEVPEDLCHYIIFAESPIPCPASTQF